MPPWATEIGRAGGEGDLGTNVTVAGHPVEPVAGGLPPTVKSRAWAKPSETYDGRGGQALAPSVEVDGLNGAQSHITRP